jgi:hypothetical protein
MMRLSNFIAEHRNAFSVNDGNVFVTSFSKVTRHWVFLEIIRARYAEASTALVANSRAFQLTMKPGGPHTMTPEQVALQQEAWWLGNLVHLEIESFYLFAKILLDEMAHGIENYFGPSRGLSLDSHDDLCKCLRKYGETKGLTITTEFEHVVADLRRRISDFRDAQVAHEKSPRTLKGIAWDATGKTRFVSNRLYPVANDRQVESESLDSLAAALESYVDQIVAFLRTNQSNARFKPAEGQGVTGG